MDNRDACVDMDECLNEDGDDSDPRNQRNYQQSAADCKSGRQRGQRGEACAKQRNAKLNFDHEIGIGEECQPCTVGKASVRI